ncbi:MAG: polymorphic toxin-type HINT domain-containing protein [Pirellulales bacterium]|nr:polymorphic toxin-type HINT domain-containing protein [Pirellulales bacterium]
MTNAFKDSRRGDLVWAADPQSGVSGPRRVVEVYRNPTRELLHLTLRGESNGKNLPEFSFVTTREHPFWTTNRGWVAAGELVPGDSVRQLDGTVGQVLGSAVQTLPTPITVYNFQVEGLHTYFVLPGAEGTPVEQDVAGLAFLVHNANGKSCAKQDPPNKYGSKGKPDHQQKVDELESKARGEAKEGETVLRERKLQGHDSSRIPDVQIVDPAGRARKTLEAERHPNRNRNLQREEEYNGLGLENETHGL